MIDRFDWSGVSACVLVGLSEAFQLYSVASVTALLQPSRVARLRDSKQARSRRQSEETQQEAIRRLPESDQKAMRRLKGNRRSSHLLG